MLDLSNHLGVVDQNEKIAMDLFTAGWSVVPDFLPTAVVSQLREDLLTHWHDGEFNQAGVGRGNERIIDKRIRSDEVKWLSPDAATEAQTIYWQAIDQLRGTLNRQLFLGLDNFEAHMTLYKAGSYYKRHVDQFRGVGLRVVTAILYLNDGWQQEQGGELVMYPDMESTLPMQIFYPLAGQLVVFMSADFPHEVLPATRQRMSMTGWFKKRELV